MKNPNSNISRDSRSEMDPPRVGGREEAAAARQDSLRAHPRRPGRGGRQPSRQQLPGAAARVETLVRYVTVPVGQVFLRLLFMTVVPWCSPPWRWAWPTSRLEAHRADRPQNDGDLPGTTARGGYRLILVNLSRPGDGFDPAVQRKLLEDYRGP